MKKLIILLSVLAMTLSMSGSVFADDSTTSGTAYTDPAAVTNTAAIQDKVKDKKAAAEQRKAEAKDFKEAVKAQRDVVQANRDNNQALRQENASLRKELKSDLKTLKDSGTTLDAETAAKLETYNAQLKAVIDELKGTKGAIKDIAADKKESLKAKDYEAMEAAFTQIGEIQDERNASLVKINEILKEMIALLPV